MPNPPLKQRLKSRLNEIWRKQGLKRNPALQGDIALKESIIAKRIAEAKIKTEELNALLAQQKMQAEKTLALETTMKKEKKTVEQRKARAKKNKTLAKTKAEKAKEDELLGYHALAWALREDIHFIRTIIGAGILKPSGTITLQKTQTINAYTKKDVREQLKDSTVQQKITRLFTNYSIKARANVREKLLRYRK